MASAPTLTSPSSDRVKAVRALHDKAGRRRSGRFLVEGPQAVRNALVADAGVVVREVFVADDAGIVLADLVDAARARDGVRLTTTTGPVLAAMAETEQPQGILAVCDLLVAPALSEIAGRPGPLVVLEAVSDPGNVGTVIRTAAAAGAAGVVLTPGCADVHNGKVVRSTAGSLFHLPVAPGVELSTLVDTVRAAGRRLAVATGDAADDLFGAARAGRLDGRTCWIVGSEAHGVSTAARTAADLAVRIPMAPGPESLNAAVAVAVVLYVTAYAVSAPSQPG